MRTSRFHQLQDCGLPNPSLHGDHSYALFRDALTICFLLADVRIGIAELRHSDLIIIIVLLESIGH